MLVSACRLGYRVPRCGAQARRFRQFAAARGSVASVSSASASTSTMAVQIERVHALNDNYVWLVHDSPSGQTAVVDPSETEPVQRALAERGWALHYIWNTHHHHDHTGGNVQLKEAHPGLKIIGPRADKDRIPGIDVTVGDGDVFDFAGHAVTVYDTPGHTRGHITFHVPDAEALFPGDTLFVLGCGRLFEGTPQQMWASLSKLLPLPDNTRVFCAHEYTASNARFAVTVDPANAALQARKVEIDDLRAKGLPTVPSLLGAEKATNPFLRYGTAWGPFAVEIRAQLGSPADSPDWQVFGAIRAAKDSFRG